MASPNVTWQPSAVGREERWRRLGQRGCVLWLTGLSGSGKSTLANALDRTLVEAGRLAYILDGDNIRHGLNADLGFAPADRTENIRRIGEVAALFADAGLIVITAFISPYRSDRARARQIAEGSGIQFLEVFLDVPLAVCEERDPKGLYRKARGGEIREFTGIDAPYEAPDRPELVVPTAQQSLGDSVEVVMGLLKDRGVVVAVDRPVR